MIRKKEYIVLPVVLLALLAAFSVPASAVTGGCPSETRYSETIHGCIYYVAKAPPSAVFTDVPDGIRLARLYTGAWGGSPGNCVDFNLTINDFTTETYHACDPASYPERCSVIDTPECRDYVTGCGVHFITYDATPHIVPGSNTISTSVPSYYGYVLGLLVVYEDPSMPEITYWINEGSPLMISGSGCDPDSDEIFIYFNGTTGSPHAMNYWTLGFPGNAGVNPELNGNDIGAPDYTGYVYRWDNILTSYLNPSTNLFHYYHPGADYERVHSAVLMLEQGASAPDTTPPYTTGHDPAPGATDVPPDANIVIHVRDAGTGVNQSTIVMTVEGSEVTPAITGDIYDYTLTYNPPADFDYGQVVDITVDAADLNETPNVMLADSYSFTIKELKPAAPFMIYGWVNYDNGDPVNDPNVTVTTSEIYEVETITTANYYQVSTCSGNVSIGDVLHFTASAETTTAFDYTITAADMNRGGFEQNITSAKLPRPDLVVTRIDAYHNKTFYPEERFPPYFNLSNEIDITVENAGSNAVNPSHVSLYVDSEFFGKQSVPALDIGCNATVQFKWSPTGADCEDGGTPITYTLQAVADCDNEIEEIDEGNNESITEETAYWAGYSADEVLSTAFHGTIHGGLNVTTGDGIYTGLYCPGVSTDIHYDITLPAGVGVELARLNVYYTWSKTDVTGVYPSMEVRITNASGTYILSSEKEYNDRPCDSPAIVYDYPFGNYVYDITGYIHGSGSYTVTVKNNGPSGHSFAIDPPGMVILYNDSTKPEYEYWILEGADVLEGGRRGGAGNLALSECINNATFDGTIDLSKMVCATLGLATPWGGDGANPSYLYVNGNERGHDVYRGYHETYSETLNGMAMHIGSTNAQMGVNLTDVTRYLEASDNVVGQGDEGDSMLVANAFLLVEYIEKKDDVANVDIPVKGTVTGSYVDTHTSDDVYEAITEIESKGKPDNRYSYLEHKWTVDVTGGSSVTFYVEANRTDSGEGDNVNVSYSTDDRIYTDMVTVTSDDNMCQSYELPSDLSGTVYIRVMDTDQTAGKKTLDTIYIDHMFIRSVFGAPDTTAPAAVTDLAASGPTSSTITLTWTAPGDDGNAGTATSYDIRYSTAMITEANWSSAAQCTEEPSPEPAGSGETFTVTGLDANTTYYFALKTSDEVPNESPLSNGASNTTEEASASMMHIARIDMSLKTAGPNTNAIALVTIVDAADAPVGSATVEGHWSDATTDSDSGTTDAGGQVSLNSDKVKNADPGTTFTFTVDNVVKAGWTYDSDANVETSDSISV
jgi:hypothetical protein